MSASTGYAGNFEPAPEVDSALPRLGPLDRARPKIGQGIESTAPWFELVHETSSIDAVNGLSKST
jgi:hypothetical protein